MNLNIYLHACRASSMDAIPNLLDTAIIYSAMTDYPRESGFLNPLPAHPVFLSMYILLSKDV